MIVTCAYCGPLPMADLEELGDLAWAKHVAEGHPEWPPGVAGEHEWPPPGTPACPELIDGQATAPAIPPGPSSGSGIATSSRRIPDHTDSSEGDA